MSEIKVNSIKGVGATDAAITVNNSDGTCTANITSIGGGQLSNRNKVINGSMIIHQRGGSKTGNEYTLDRFHVSSSTDGAYSVSQSTESPDDFSNSLHVDCTTADTSVASGQYLQLKHAIEGQNLQDLAKGTSSAKKTVLSFYVKTNLTGTYAVAIYDGDNNRLFETTYTVSNTNWNRYTIDIPADTTGALGNDNGSSIELYWALVQGSSRTSGSASTSWGSYSLTNFAVGHNVNFLSSTDNNWYLTGVQFEKSDTGVATDFEHRSFAQEIQLCKRYYEVLVNGNGLNWGGVAVMHTSDSPNHVCNWVEKRATPSLEFVEGSGYYRYYSNDTYLSANKPSSLAYATKISGIISTASSLTSGSLVAGGAAWSYTVNANAYIAVSAEL